MFQIKLMYNDKIFMQTESPNSNKAQKSHLCLGVVPWAKKENKGQKITALLFFYEIPFLIMSHRALSG